SRPSLSIRRGAATSPAPARLSAAAVPAPTANHCWPSAGRSGCNFAAARTAIGLVNNTRDASSAACKPARAPSSSRACNRHGDSAMIPPPRRAAARRIGPCWPRGRSEITYHAGNGGVSVDIAPAYSDHLLEPRMPHAEALQRLNHHYQSMPPVAVMDLSIAAYDGQRLQLHAPLARHVNDKGCAFGGSLASMMTLASWGLVSLQLEAAGIDADVFVADSQIRYLAPLFDDIE